MKTANITALKRQEEGQGTCAVSPRHSKLQDYTVCIKLWYMLSCEGFSFYFFFSSFQESCQKMYHCLITMKKDEPFASHWAVARSKTEEPPSAKTEIEPSLLDSWVGFDAAELDQPKSSTDASQEENGEKGISYRFLPLYLLSHLSASSASYH